MCSHRSASVTRSPEGLPFSQGEQVIRSQATVVTRVTTGWIRQHFPDEETDGAHVDGRSNTGCSASNPLPR